MIVVESIKRLRQDEHPLTVQSIWRDRSRKTTKVLVQVTGKATTGASLHDAARRYFGSWDKALERAGINPDSVKEKPFWTRKKIVRSIKTLHIKGVALNSSRIGSASSRLTAWMIERELGKRRAGRSLYGAAYRIFGSWDRALYEAGLNPLVHRRKAFSWNTRQLARILNILHQMQIPVNRSSLSTDTSDQTASIIFDLSGQRTTGTYLYRLCNQKLGSWDAALKFSGFWLSEIRRSGSPCDRNPERIVDIIRIFRKNDLALNRSAMILNSNKSKFLVEKNFGVAVSGSSVLAAAQEVFGSWDQALWEAGLDFNEIRRRSRPHATSLPIVTYQVEDTKRDGEFSRSKFLGTPSRTPEDQLNEMERADKLQNAVEQLSSEDQGTADRVFDAILQVHHYKDQGQLIKFVVQHLDYEVTEDQVRRLFSQLIQRMDQTGVDIQ